MTTRPSLVQPIKIARAYEQLAGLLRERITSGDLRVGDRLPSESALAEQAGVSRSTVREALRILEQGGLVERASPRIMVVADRSEDPGFRELRHALRQHNVTFHHLHEAMMVLDPELTRFAAIRADRSDIQELQVALAAQEEHLDHLAEWSRLDVEFHAMLAEISANPALIIAREPVSQVLIPALYRFMDTRDMAEHATKYHRRIVEEIEVRDPDTAAAVMRRHINDWRTAWEKRGLDLHQEILDLSYTTDSEPNTVISTDPHEEDEKMGFVKNAEEIARIEHALSFPRFVGGQMLSVEFTSDESVVAEVLPPPLEPAGAPNVRAMVGRWQSNCVGDFYGGAIYVAARHDGIDGEYVLAMYMDNDVPTIYGRDLFGEPKKIADSALLRRGEAFRGWVERGGVRIIELQGEMSGEDAGRFDAEGYNFNFKARPAADGHGLEEDAILTRAKFEVHATASLEGAGSVVLRGTVHDPLDEIPVRSVTKATYLECDLIGKCEAVATTPADVFLPYHHGRHDDWSALDTESAPLVPVA